MNERELNKFRKDYYKKLEECIQEKDSITLEDFNRVLQKVLMQTKIENETSNKIMLYIGSYTLKDNKLGSREILTYDGNVNAKYKKYIDIETQEIYKVEVSRVKEFEKEYITVDMPVSIYNLQEYLKNYNHIREIFFKKLIYNPQDKVVNKIKNKDLK